MLWVEDRTAAEHLVSPPWKEIRSFSVDGRQSTFPKEQEQNQRHEPAVGCRSRWNRSQRVTDNGRSEPAVSSERKPSVSAGQSPGTASAKATSQQRDEQEPCRKATVTRAQALSLGRPEQSAGCWVKAVSERRQAQDAPIAWRSVWQRFTAAGKSRAEAVRVTGKGSKPAKVLAGNGVSRRRCCVSKREGRANPCCCRPC